MEKKKRSRNKTVILYDYPDTYEFPIGEFSHQGRKPGKEKPGRKSKGIWSEEVQLWLLKLLVFFVQRLLY